MAGLAEAFGRHHRWVSAVLAGHSPAERARPAQRGGRGPRAQRADLDPSLVCGGLPDPCPRSSRPTSPVRGDEWPTRQRVAEGTRAAAAACS